MISQYFNIRTLRWTKKKYSARSQTEKNNRKKNLRKPKEKLNKVQKARIAGKLSISNWTFV